MKTRAFVCIEFPGEVIKEVARIQSLIEKQKFTGKLTELENLHLTLKFLGEISPEQLEKVKEKLSSIKFPAFEAKLLNLGTFSYKDQPKIIWLKIGGKSGAGGRVEGGGEKSNIYELQKQIDESLKETFQKEERFMSHLTIARIKHTKSPDIFKEYLKNISVKPISFQINSFFLKSSELKPLGPVYTTFAEYKLVNL